MTLEEANFFWKTPRFCPPPLFPILFFEIKMARECRGFIKLEYLTGDIDFVRYPLVAEEFIIDSEGKLFDLGYEKIVFPKQLTEVLSKAKLLDLVRPSILFSNDLKLLKEVEEENRIDIIIYILANKFTW